MCYILNHILLKNFIKSTQTCINSFRVASGGQKFSPSGNKCIFLSQVLNVRFGSEVKEHFPKQNRVPIAYSSGKKRKAFPITIFYSNILEQISSMRQKYLLQKNQN